MNQGFACFQANLRLRITIVVGLQCCLLLAYLEYSSNGATTRQQPHHTIAPSNKQHITSYGGQRKEHTIETLGDQAERLHRQLPNNVIIPSNYTPKPAVGFSKFSSPLDASYYARAIEKARENFKKVTKDTVKSVTIKSSPSYRSHTYVYRREYKDAQRQRTGVGGVQTGDSGRQDGLVERVDVDRRQGKENQEVKAPSAVQELLDVAKKDIHSMWQKDDLIHSNRPRISRTSKGNLFRSLDLSNPPLYYLSSDPNLSFRQNDKYQCYIAGTVTGLNASRLTGMQGCLCKRNWHGKHCSVPNPVYVPTSGPYVDSVTPRNTSRRIISALLFNMEYELLEARLNELHDVVDVFLIMESNYTSYGEPKPLRLLNRLRTGYLREFHSKISYLFLDHFHPEGKLDGWKADEHARTYLGVEGMRQIKNTRPDDLFIYTDADEIPSRETLMFLKVHDGYPEPIGFTLRWSVYSFFWKQYEPTRLVVGCTLGVFKYVFQNHADRLRSAILSSFDMNLLTPYTRTRALVYDWFIGDALNLAGWHCSWCLSPDRIRIKLTSAINADFPRWGGLPGEAEDKLHREPHIHGDVV